MKMLMLLGAGLGLLIGGGFSLISDSPWPSVVWRAGIAAYVAGMLLKWWGRRWEENLRTSLLARRTSEEKTTSKPLVQP